MSRPRVLIIDDEAMLLRVLQRALSSRYAVTTAATKDEAMAMLRVAEFDVVLCDIHLGRVHGSEVLEEAMALRPGIEPRFLFWSGGSLNEADLTFLDGVASIVKPCTPDLLAARMDLLPSVMARREEG